jgi:hypothetical protein
MRKIFTVLLIITMLSMPTRFASASGDGGGIVVLNTISAFTQPTTFITVVLLSYVIVNSVFAPQIVTLPPAIRSRAVLAMTATLTLEFFRSVMAESVRYFLYVVTFSPYFSLQSPASSAAATDEETQSGLWSASNPDVMTTAVPIDTEKDKQETINKAVQGALRDPEVAKKYLEYATPEVKAAVTRALENQAADRARF